MNRDGLRSLCGPLPAPLAQWKEAGLWHELETGLAQWLKRDLPQALRQRLEAEQWLLKEVKKEYPLDFASLLAKLRQRVPDYGEDELRALEQLGKLDSIGSGRRRRFSARQADTLLKVNADFARRAGQLIEQQKPRLDGIIADMKAAGEAAVRFTVSVCAQVNRPVKNAGYRLYLPLPIPAAQQREIQLLEASPAPALIAPEDAFQRTALFENEPRASMRYAYTQRVRYAEPSGPAPKKAVYRDRPPTEDDLAECPPHLAFTPYLRALAAEVAGGATDGMEKARRVYDFVTKTVDYSFMPPYRVLEDGAEYAAANLRGDCGIQALLFIALCRLNGVPARWQSGLYADVDGLGSHDWAQFYALPFGWLFADCSFGGSAWRAVGLGGDEAAARARHEFYFGNLDPYRLVFNRAYFAPFDPPTRFLRWDPYDNQTGEMESAKRALKPEEWSAAYTVEEEKRL